MKRILQWIVPYNLWVRLRIISFNRRRRLNVIEGAASADSLDYDSLIKLLVAKGCPESAVRDGSMPEENLKAIVAAMRSILGPVYGLHVGNFVGISLTYLTAAAVRQNAESQMVSIDPNISHRGIDRPMEHVMALLTRAGVQKNSIILTGYSLQKSVGNDGLAYAGTEDPQVASAHEAACENQLQQLATLCPGRFNFVVIDGNHEGSYLEKELRQAHELMAPDGLLVVDDIGDSWIELQRAFERVAEGGIYETVLANDRIGILRKKR